MKIKLSLLLIVLMIVAIALISGWVLLTGDDRTVELNSSWDLLTNKEEYNGKDVAIKGKIITQCARGCMFDVDDGTGVIFVEMKGEAWEKPLPPSIGKTVEVRGTFFQSPRPHIIVEKREHVRGR